MGMQRFLAFVRGGDPGGKVSLDPEKEALSKGAGGVL